MKGIKPLELDEAKLSELQLKLEKRELSEADCEQLKALIDLLRFLGTVRRFVVQLTQNPSAWMPWNYQVSAAGPPQN